MQRLLRVLCLTAATTAMGFTSAAAAEPLRLERIEIRDPAMNDMVAFTMLKPKGWSVEGGVQWNHNLSNLASAGLRIMNPEQTIGLQMFPVVPLTWNPAALQYFEPGQNYLGNLLYEPTDDVAYYVSEVLLSQYRAELGAELLQREPLPKVAATIQQQVSEPMMRTSVAAERVRVRYIIDGAPYVEDFYVALSYKNGDMLPDAWFWQAERQYSFWAPEGELEGIAPLLQSVVNSVRVTPEWYSGYLQVLQMSIRNRQQAIADAGALARYQAKVYEEIREINMEAWENQQRAQDKANQDFNDVIRGIERYKDPHDGEQFEVPLGHEDVWVNALGEYILSDDVNYDPNQHSGQTWERATPSKD